jgi:hypothetical protein
VCEQVWVSVTHIAVVEVALGDEGLIHSLLEVVENSGGWREDQNSVHGLSVEMGDMAAAPVVAAAVAGTNRVVEGVADTTVGSRQTVVVHQHRNWEMVAVVVKEDSSMLGACLEKVCDPPAAAQLARALP